MYRGKLYEFEGETLPVKVIAGKVELAPSTLYKYLKQGFSLYDAIEEGKKKSSIVFKTKPKTNNRVARRYSYNDEMLTVEEIANLEKISPENLYRRLSKGMQLQDAVEEIKKNISLKYPFQGGFYSTYKISVISGIPQYFIEKKIDKEREYTEEEFNAILASYRKEILMVGSQTLYQYCIQNQYNYNVIFGMIKTKGVTVEEAISTYLREGQHDNFKYTYFLGNILLYHFFIKECLNDRYISERLQKGDSVEDAIMASIFLAGEEYSTRTIRNELYTLYRQLGLEETLKKGIAIEHKEYIMQKHLRVQEVMKEFHLYQAVAFLSTDLSEEDRNDVLKRFNLTAEDLLQGREELFDGFTERRAYQNAGPVSYVWDISSKKS